MEVTKEGRGIVMLVELNADEARDLGTQLTTVAG